MSFIIRVYTPAYVLIGQSESKQTLDLSEVQGFSLDPNATLVDFSQPTVTFPKRQVVAIDLVSPEAQASVQLTSRAELAVLYTDRFVIQANMHPSGEMPVSNMFNVVGGDFIPVSDARLYPLVPTRKLPTDNARVLVLNKQSINFYHARM
jgi:hypothetical protein